MYVHVVSLSVLFPRVDQGTGGTPIYIIRQDVTFIFTDQDVINDNFLEIMNSILATGEAGLMNLGLKIGYMMIHPWIWDTYFFQGTPSKYDQCSNAARRVWNKRRKMLRCVPAIHWMDMFGYILRSLPTNYFCKVPKVSQVRWAVHRRWNGRSQCNQPHKTEDGNATHDMAIPTWTRR